MHLQNRKDKDRSRCHTGEGGDLLGDVYRKGWAKAAAGSVVKQLLFHWHSVCPATSKAVYWTSAVLTPRLSLHLLAFFAIFLFSSLEVIRLSFVVSYITSLPGSYLMPPVPHHSIPTSTFGDQSLPNRHHIAGQHLPIAPYCAIFCLTVLVWRAVNCTGYGGSNLCPQHNITLWKLNLTVSTYVTHTHISKHSPHSVTELSEHTYGCWAREAMKSVRKQRAQPASSYLGS